MPGRDLQALARIYEEQGWVLVPDLFDQDDLAAMRSRIEWLLDGAAAALLAEGATTSLHADQPFDQRSDYHPTHTRHPPTHAHVRLILLHTNTHTHTAHHCTRTHAHITHTPHSRATALGHNSPRSQHAQPPQTTSSPPSPPPPRARAG